MLLRDTLTIQLTDETGVDPESIQFKLGGSATIGIDDSRLEYSDGILTYIPEEGAALGEYEQEITVELGAPEPIDRILDLTFSGWGIPLVEVGRPEAHLSFIPTTVDIGKRPLLRIAFLPAGCWSGCEGPGFSTNRRSSREGRTREGQHLQQAKA